jgi:hypothetical protein
MSASQRERANSLPFPKRAQPPKTSAAWSLSSRWPLGLSRYSEPRVSVVPSAERPDPRSVAFGRARVRADPDPRPRASSPALDPSRPRDAPRELGAVPSLRRAHVTGPRVSAGRHAPERAHRALPETVRATRSSRRGATRPRRGCTPKRARASRPRSFRRRHDNENVPPPQKERCFLFVFFARDARRGRLGRRFD